MNQLINLKKEPGSITNAKILFDKIKEINIDYTQENFILICLNSKNKLINSKIMHIGGLNECTIDTKTIFRKALLSNANSVIFAHNHPSDDLKPSIEDIKIYDQLKKAGKIISIKCLDSIIFNKTEYYSMEEQ